MRLQWTGKPPANGKQDKGGPEKLDRRINRAITARHVRLVSNEGHEILTRYEALTRAHHAGLDLVEVDGKSDPPVCKLMDFSKERFKDKRREKELRKKQVSDALMPIGNSYAWKL
jgi:translation initiation factor IF-3